MLKVHFLPKEQAIKSWWIDGIYGETKQLIRFFGLADQDGVGREMGVFIGKGAIVTMKRNGRFIVTMDPRCKHTTIIVAIQDGFWRTLRILSHELLHFVNYTLFHGISVDTCRSIDKFLHLEISWWERINGFSRR